MIAYPVEQVRAMPHPGARHADIALPSGLYPDRRNSDGIDLSDENALAMLTRALAESAQIGWTARPEGGEGAARPVLNPAEDRKSTRLNSRHYCAPRLPSSA